MSSRQSDDETKRVRGDGGVKKKYERSNFDSCLRAALYLALTPMKADRGFIRL